jgi:hypothetical protein
LAINGSTPQAAAVEGIGHVRTFAPGDVARVVALRRRMFQRSRQRSAVELERYFRERFLAHAPFDGWARSVLHEAESGQVDAFLGCMPRLMMLGDRPLRVGIATQLMVSPSAPPLVLRRLVEAFMEGGQDLVLSDAANDAARRVTERFGGFTLVAHSLSWHRSLREARDAAARWATTSRRRALALLARPAATLADAIAGPPARGPGAPAPGDHVEPFDIIGSVAWMNAVLAHHALRPLYDAEGLALLLGELERKQELGVLQRLRVRDAHDRSLGWILYYLNPGGTSHVVQVGARRGEFARVLAQLIAHAWAGGAVALEGRVDPHDVGALARAECSFSHDGPWVCGWTRDAAVRDAVLRGDIYLSRLECEWWTNF